MKTAFTSLALALLPVFAAANHNPSPYFAPTPLELIAFEPQGIDRGVVLFFETAVEWQTDSYTIQRSSDGTDWEAIGSLEAGGNHVGPRRYVFVDEAPYAGNNFYRVVSRDFAGETGISDYVDLEYTGAYDPMVYPNPAVPGSDINVRFDGFENQEMQVELIDLNGRRLERRSFGLTEGPNVVTFPAPNVRNGVYLVRVFVDDYPVTSYRLMMAAS